MVVLDYGGVAPNDQLCVFGEFVSFGASSSNNASGGGGGGGPKSMPSLLTAADGSPVQLAVGDVVEASALRQLCRDKLNPTKPWMEAERLDSTRFAFNRDKKGWHYGWASNKHTCNANHALQAYLFERVVSQDDGDNTCASPLLRVLGIYQTPKFTLFCRRRRRFAMVPSAPIAPPASKRECSAPNAKRRRKDESPPDTEEEEDGEEEEEEQDFNPSPMREIVMRDGSGGASCTMERVEKALRAISHRVSQLHRNNPDPTALRRHHHPRYQNEHLTQAAQFSLDLFECIDYFAENSSVLDEEAEATDAFVVEEAAASSCPNASLVDDLISFLFEEDEFTKSLNDFLQLAEERAMAATEDSALFPAFVALISNHLARFLELKEISLAEFDAMFPSSSSAVSSASLSEMLAKKTFQQITLGAAAVAPSERAEEMVDIMPQVLPPPSTTWSELERIQGLWIQCDNTPLAAEAVAATTLRPHDEGQNAESIEMLRESLGYPWILRKMLRFMEEKFEVKLEENQVLHVRLQRKLFSSGAMRIILDGEEHVWGMKLPLFEGISNAWKYRAWVDDEGIVHHVHDTGDTQTASRMRRKMWVDANDELIIDVALEELDPALHIWSVMARSVQRAKRC